MRNNDLLDAIKLLNNCVSVSLAIVKEDGYPNIYAMEKVSSEGLQQLIFITKKNSNKVKILHSDNKACVECHTENESVSLLGKVKIIEDEIEKQKILPSNYQKRLNKSGSSQYCVLCFKTEEANLFIGNKKEVVNFTL